MVEETREKNVWAPNLERVISEVGKNARNEAKVMRGVEKAIENGKLYEILKNAGVDERVIENMRNTIESGVNSIESTRDSLSIYCNKGRVEFRDDDGITRVDIVMKPYRQNNAIIPYNDKYYNEKYKSSRGRVATYALDTLRKIGEKENPGKEDQKNFEEFLEVLIDTFHRAFVDYYSVKEDTKKYNNGLTFEVVE